MSRNSPFPSVPSRRPRSPPPPPNGYSNASMTPPLSINRARSISQVDVTMQPRRPARSERRPRNGPSSLVRDWQMTGNIDAILDVVKEDWEDVMDDDFNPVTLALALLDDSSAGRDMQSFVETKRSLEEALKGSVDKHYKAFAHALPHHANLSMALTKTQAELSEARTHLMESRDALGNKRADLVQLWSRGQTLEEMMRLLDEIERLKSVPDLLESLISEKRLLQAAVLLMKSLKAISKPDMLEIGALSDLRSYLTSQETALRDILLEELHSHLYLKTFWCDRRWAPFMPNQTKLPVVEFDLPKDSSDVTLSDENKTRQTRLDRFLIHLNLRTNNESPLELLDDSIEAILAGRTSHVHPAPSPSYNTSGINGGPNGSSSTTSSSISAPENPESDSFTYIETLLEALTALGKLVGALDTVVNRLPVELYNLIEITIDEVNDRSEFARPNPASGVSGISTVSPGGNPTGYVLVEDHETLRDLFWTLYSKLNAVLQGFRVTYEIANRIGQRRDFKDSSGVKPTSLFPLADIWSPIQIEISQLLLEYLRDDDHTSISGRNPIASINEVLRTGAYSRDKSKTVFRFGDTDTKAAGKALKKHDEELSRVLKETVPGLVTGPAESSSTTLSTIGMEDRFAGAGQHRLLIRPDAFHVSALFQPTLAWLDSVSNTFPTTSAFAVSEVQGVLDEFILNAYLPQLEEKVLTLFHQAVSAPDAFHEDPGWKLLSPRPLVKASTQLFALINSLCAMMRVTPFHRENYARLILAVIIQFYQRCSDRLQTLATHDGRRPLVIMDPSKLLMPAAWAHKPEVATVLRALRAVTLDDETKLRSLCEQETQIELSILSGKAVGKDDNLGSPRSISALASLYESITWFISQLVRLRQVDEDSHAHETNAESSTSELSAYPSRIPPISPAALEEDLKLPLTGAMVLRYDSLLRTYDHLAELVLWTIRLDIRCRTLHALQKGMREDSYRIDQDALEPDLFIVDLNSELAGCDDCTALTLQDRERRFIFQGLGSLMEQVLIMEAQHIRSVNEAGIRKVFRNIMALQQGLKAIDVITQDADFARARTYYSLFSLTPARMLDTVREKAIFSFEEYKVVLSLQCGVDQSLGDSAISGTSDYRLHLINLETLTISDD